MKRVNVEVYLLLLSFVTVVAPTADFYAKDCCHGQVIDMKIPGFDWEPYIKIDPESGTAVGGQAFRILNELTSLTGVTINLHPDVAYNPGYPYAGDIGSSYVACSETVNCSAVYFDAGSDLGFESLSKNVVLSAPVFQSEGGVLVHKAVAPTSDWRLFEPFSSDLWGATVGFSVLTAFLMVLVAEDGVDAKQTSGNTLHQGWKPRIISIVTSLYHSFVMLLGGEDYEWLNWPGRLLRTGYLFFGLILISTYTANLAAFFTKPSFTIYGPKTFTQLKESTICVWSPVFAHTPGLLVGSVVTPDMDPAFVDDGTVTNRYKYCHDAVTSGAVDGWYDVITTLNSYMIDNCETDNLHLDATLRFGRMGYVLAFHADNAELAHNLSSAIWYLERTPAKQEIYAEYFHMGKSCDDAVQGEGGDDETTPVTFGMMRGLFFVYIGFAIAAVLVNVVQRRVGGSNSAGYGHDPSESGAGPRPHPQLGYAATEGEMLRYVIGILDRMDDNSGTGGSEQLQKQHTPNAGAVVHSV